MQKMVGITCGKEDDQFVLRRYYVQALSRVGVAAVILPASGSAAELADSLADKLDGLLLSGGGDFRPQLWGEYAHYALACDWQRMKWEISLLAAFQRKKKPVLGICRGMQLMNIAWGGSLWQDLGERPDALEHWQQTPPEQPCHRVRCRGELAGWLGGTEIAVNSVHHQAVRRVGAGLRVLAVAEDGVIEAIGRTQGGFCLGVQWHPERLAHNLGLWQAFAAALN